MKLGGVSIQGKTHKVNQDAFLFFTTETVTVLAVSDGLGSLSRSREGAKTLCDILQALVKTDVLPYEDMEETARMVQVGWLCLLEKRGVPSEEAYATCLICILRESAAYIFRLGDGFLGLRADGETKVFFDDKEDSFLNETFCLHENFVPCEWEMLCWQFDEFEGVIICSDGVDIACEGMSAEESLAAFTNEFLRVYGKRSVAECEEDIRGWLCDWKSTDDKTLVFGIGAGAYGESNSLC